MFEALLGPKSVGILPAPQSAHCAVPNAPHGSKDIDIFLVILMLLQWCLFRTLEFEDICPVSSQMSIPLFFSNVVDRRANDGLPPFFFSFVNGSPKLRLMCGTAPHMFDNM